MEEIKEFSLIYLKLQKNIAKILFSNKPGKSQKILLMSITAKQKADKWAEKYVPIKFNKAAKKAQKKLTRLREKKKRNINKEKIIKSRINIIKDRVTFIHNSIMFFVNEYIAINEKTNGFVVANIQNFYREPVKFRKTVLGAEVKKEVRAGLTIFDRYTKTGFLYRATLSRGEIQRNIKKLLIRKFGDIDFIAITTRSGKIRRYQLKTYTEMLARTEMSYIQNRAIKVTCQEWENDLVIILPGFSKCTSGICDNYAGQIFSLSGRSKTYPVLDVEFPLHPNCVHGMSPTTQEGIAADKEREAA